MAIVPEAAPDRAPTGVRPFAVVLGILTIAVVAGLWYREPTVSAFAPIRTPTALVESDSAAFRIVPLTTTTADAASAFPVLVADPRPGDLRTDAAADILPVDYLPGPAVTTLLDIAYGTEPAQRLDLHLPADAEAPVLLYLHSGGWGGGDKAAVPDMVMRFVERGYAVASVEYHLAPEHTFPAPVTDVKLAIRWLKAYAERERLIDGDRIVLIGASSGGHLAAFVAATRGEYEPVGLAPELTGFDSKVAGVVSFVGPTDLMQLYDQRHDWARGMTSAFVGCFPCTNTELAEPSIAAHLRSGLPPAYWAYGTEDPLVDVDSQAVAVAVAWAAAGGADSSWLDLVDGAGHTLDHSLVNQRALEAFVDAAVGPG